MRTHQRRHQSMRYGIEHRTRCGWQYQWENAHELSVGYRWTEYLRTESSLRVWEDTLTQVCMTGFRWGGPLWSDPTLVDRCLAGAPWKVRHARTGAPAGHGSTSDGPQWIPMDPPPPPESNQRWCTLLLVSNRRYTIVGIRGQRTTLQMLILDITSLPII